MSEHLPTLLPSISRDNSVQEEYVGHLRDKYHTGDTSCDLCASVERQRQRQDYIRIGGQVIRLGDERFTIIKNDFPYRDYDGCEVMDHHMLVPTDHVSQGQLMRNQELRHAYIDTLAALEPYYGLNMSRHSSSTNSSIRYHAHTHLIQSGAVVIEKHFSIADNLNRVKFSEH